MPTNNEPVIFKTKYTRRREGKPESFVGYELSISDKEHLTFPKGTTLSNIKKAYPEYANAILVVMPSHILKGINTANCENITHVAKRIGFITTPADVTIEVASQQEQAEDFAVEPDGTIYAIERERPTNGADSPTQ